MAHFDKYVILQLLFRLRQNEIVPQMTSSSLPWKRFDDMASFDLEEMRADHDEMSRHFED